MCRIVGLMSTSPKSRSPKARVLVVRRGSVEEITEPFGGNVLRHSVKTVSCCLRGVLKVVSGLDLFHLGLGQFLLEPPTSDIATAPYFSSSVFQPASPSLSPSSDLCPHDAAQL